MTTRKKHLYVDKDLILGYYLRTQSRVVEQGGMIELRNTYHGDDAEKALLELNFNYRNVLTSCDVTDPIIENQNKGVVGILCAEYVSGSKGDGTAEAALGIGKETIRYTQDSRSARHTEAGCVDLNDYGVFTNDKISISSILYRELPVTCYFRYKVETPPDRSTKPWFHFAATYAIDETIVHDYYINKQFKVDLDYIDTDTSLYNLLI